MTCTVRIATLSMAVAVSLAGCAITPTDRIYDSAPRHPTTQVQVVRGDVDRPYTIIAQLTGKAGKDDTETAIDVLIRKAKALGADAVLLNPPHTDTPSPGFTSANFGPETLPTATASGSDANGVTAWAVAFKKQ